MNRNYSPNYRSRAKKPFYKKILPLLGVIGSLCAVLAVLAAAGYYFLTPAEAATRPLVLINAPLNGDQLETSQRVTVQAVARDETKITRVELWVDGQLQETDTSSLPGGISPFPLLADWLPTTPGTHTLTVRAFNAQGRRAHASVNVEAIELPDRDGDGVADEVDACPDEASPTSDGCPLSDDRDNDGLPDAEDACPDEAGWADIDGCPTPGDADGDGVLDGEDACPEERGLPDDEGCPDHDGDGTPDHLDAAPDDPGPAESGGVPDADDDGVPDGEDLAPEDPGGEDSGGAPPGPDSDGDGAPDDDDPCPHEAGEPEDGYCPPPEADPPPSGDGSFLGEIPPFFFGEIEIGIPVQFEALEFKVNPGEEYEELWCYARLADGNVERFDFAPWGEGGTGLWNIREHLGDENSRTVLLEEGEPLSVFADCSGSVSPSEPNVYLGQINVSHPPEEWTGNDLVAEAGPGSFGHFQVRYRICSPNCSDSTHTPPLIWLRHIGITDSLTWLWDGEDPIDGFKLYRNGNYVNTFSEETRRIVTTGLPGPGCGERWEFYMTTYAGDDPLHPEWESPPSNIQTWEGEPCPRTVRVQFLSLNSLWIRERQGPIQGTFVVNDQPLLPNFRTAPPTFDATDNPRQYLEAAESVEINALFDTIATEAETYGGIHFTGNYAPSADYVDVELGPDDNLTILAHIEDTSGHTLFDGSLSLSPDEIPVPGGGGGHTIYNRNFELDVWVMGLR